ncbi:hypothetical protein OOU_Y34scaffold00312g12 [Pyricularia oryzae Y34]|uniref:Uncharacterized protein n=2 Tax=Pyricularia oryzae TaxID=318829 RepID=A0AA97P2U9_PYRO3|nr:hypothetical protein OOU_Y34scaffold00312g12 [Pyricularia oryzae Y34]
MGNRSVQLKPASVIKCTQLSSKP